MIRQVPTPGDPYDRCGTDDGRRDEGGEIVIVAAAGADSPEFNIIVLSAFLEVRERSDRARLVLVAAVDLRPRLLDMVDSLALSAAVDVVPEEGGLPIDRADILVAGPGTADSPEALRGAARSGVAIVAPPGIAPTAAAAFDRTDDPRPLAEALIRLCRRAPPAARPGAEWTAAAQARVRRYGSSRP